MALPPPTSSPPAHEFSFLNVKTRVTRVNSKVVTLLPNPFPPARVLFLTRVTRLKIELVWEEMEGSKTSKEFHFLPTSSVLTRVTRVIRQLVREEMEGSKASKEYPILKSTLKNWGVNGCGNCAIAIFAMLATPGVACRENDKAARSVASWSVAARSDAARFGSTCTAQIAFRGEVRRGMPRHKTVRAHSC